MRVFKKILILTVLINIFIIVLNINTTTSLAKTVSEMDSDAKSFINTGAKEAKKATKDVTGAVGSNFRGIGQLLTYIGAGVMVAVVSYMGIKYMISPPDKQAALKQQLIGVVVAGVVIFGAYGIWSALISILSTATS